MSALTLRGYETLATRTANHAQDADLFLAALGLCGESGEYADLVKKHRFHGHPIDLDKMTSEIGDILWYCAAACRALALASGVSISLEDVARQNIAKLQERYPEGFSHEASLNRKVAP